MPTVVAFSDNHNHLPVLPAGDVLVCAGDATRHGTAEEVKSFLGWFTSQPHQHKVLVGGNHDDEMEAEHFASMVAGTGIHYLLDQEVTVAGLRIYGSPHRPVPEELAARKQARWSAFRTLEVWAEHAWRDIPEGLDLLITHVPAAGILDTRRTGRSDGSQALLEAIERARPRFHIFGHVHRTGGQTHHGLHTVHVNVALCDDDYNLVRSPIVLEA